MDEYLTAAVPTEELYKLMLVDVSGMYRCLRKCNIRKEKWRPSPCRLIDRRKTKLIMDQVKELQ